MKSETIEEKTHAKLSPSSSKRWITCPGSVRGIAALGPDVRSTSSFAAEGTVAHEVHELAIAESKPAKDFIGRKFTADGFEFTVTEEMAEAVQESIDYINDRISQHTFEGFNCKVSLEVNSSLKALGIPGLDGGTADVIIEVYNQANLLHSVEIIDYKHGKGVAVDVVDNTQALCYAAGVIMANDLEDIKGGVRITISQPRAFHPGGNIRVWDVSKDYIDNWIDDILIPSAKATCEPNAKLVPDTEGCRFCPLAGNCSALYTLTQDVAMHDFEGDRPVTMSDEDRLNVMLHLALIRTFLSAVEVRVKDDIMGGSDAYEEHFKLVRKVSHRKFNGDAMDELLSPLFNHLDNDQLYVEKPLAMGAIEKNLKASIGAEAAKDVMAEVTNKPEGELVVAPISDKRKAQSPSSVGDFKNVT